MHISRRTAGGVSPPHGNAEPHDLEASSPPGQRRPHSGNRAAAFFGTPRGRCFMWTLGTVLTFIGLYFFYVGSFDARATVLEVMQCTHDVFTEHDVTYFLDYGSLLGAIRHQGFIPWDDTNDIDIGVLASETDQIYALGPQLARRCGYHMIHRSDVALLPGVTAFVIKRGAFRIFHNRVTPIYVDIADYEVLPSRPEDQDEAEEDEVVLTDAHYPELGFRFPMSRVLPVRRCEFEGRVFHCPHDPDFVLTQQFGCDWRVPKRGFKPSMVDDRPGLLRNHSSSSSYSCSSSTTPKP